MKRLFIVGNDAFIVHAMRFALQYVPGVNLFGVIDGEGHVRDAIREAQPELVLVDGISSGDTHAQRLSEIREEAPTALIVLVSSPLDESAMRAAFEAGAVVCMSTALGAPQLAGASNWSGPTALPAAAPAETARNGTATVEALPAAEPERPADHSPLTARELEILRAVAEGHTNARIGRQLWVTEQTVKFHLSNIYRKLGVSNRTEASRYALMHGLVAMPRRVMPDPRPGPAEDLRVQRLVRQAG
jgi:DNA-binding NarL/FixJ family response regulator